MERPQPQEFSHYRAYLRTMIRYLRRHNPKFSFRYFSKKAGYSSPNYLKLVADGQREISQAAVQKFARAFDLVPEEREAFETLVLMSRALDAAEKERYRARLKRFGSNRERVAPLAEAQYTIYSLWYAVPIRELMMQADFREDPVWIAKRLGDRVYPAEIDRALRLLEQVGLASRDKDGRLQPKEPDVETAPTIPKAVTRGYQRAMLKFSADSLSEVPIDKRNITSLTVNLSASEYTMLCERIAKFRREIVGVLEGTDLAQHREVYHLGFQLVPLTIEVEDEDED